MHVDRKPSRVAIELRDDEAELLTLALKRATFEDTPTDRQRDILDFALALLERLDPRPAE